jgi:protocatechuate 3,4-dioxygenase beta subunit
MKQARRDFLLKALIASPIIIALSTNTKSSSAKILTTPPHTEGPFYPINKLVDQNADLTFVGSNKRRARGEIHVIQGRLLNTSEEPIPNALIEIWQTNKWGRYQDPRDNSQLPWDDNFQGYGKVQTNSDGRYLFKTIKPAGYDYNGIKRTPHIHFKVTSGARSTFTTQMYFAGETQNEQDMFLSRITRKESVVVDFKSLSNNEKMGIFDIVIS